MSQCLNAKMKIILNFFQGVGLEGVERGQTLLLITY